VDYNDKLQNTPSGKPKVEFLMFLERAD